DSQRQCAYFLRLVFMGPGLGATRRPGKAIRECSPNRRYSSPTAFSTWATWPGTLTLCQTLRTTPSLSIRKVLRSMPMYLRPYMLFRTQTPYFSVTSPVASDPRVNGNSYFLLNLSCEATESRDTPITVAPVLP